MFQVWVAAASIAIAPLADFTLLKTPEPREGLVP